MDISKVLNHNLLVAKLKAYGLDSNATSFIKSHHTNRYQPCKIGDSFSEWERIIAGVPQRSILVPLLFNIFVNDIFYKLKTQTSVIMQLNPFLWMGFNCLNALWGATSRGSLLVITKFPEFLGTHFTYLRRMKGWVDLGATQWLWTRNPWTVNPAP